MLHYRTTAAFGLLLSCQLCEGVRLDAYDLDSAGNSWIYSGSANAGGEAAVALIAEIDDVGAMWHKDPLRAGKFEIQVDFEIAGEISSPSTALDGFAVWLANNITDAPVDGVVVVDKNEGATRKELGSLYGFHPNYSGFGVFFSTTTRSGSLRPSVSVLFNDGATTLKSTSDVPTDFGLYWNYGPLAGNPSSTFSLLISADNSRATVSVRRTAADSWKQVAGVSGVFDVSGYLGISGANTRLSAEDGESYPAVVVVRQLSVVSSEPDYVAKLADVQVGADKAAEKDTGFSAGPREALFDPRQESKLNIMIRQIIDINERQQKMAATVDSLMKHLAAPDSKVGATNVQQALEDIRNDLLMKKEERLAGGDVENDRIKNLQENAASLESTVRQATTVTTYLAGGLGVCFVAFGALIYRRMREMEKKHFL